jgi:hypothetical protein
MQMYYNPDNGFSASSWFSTIAGAMYNEYLDYWEQQNVESDSDLSDSDRRRFARLMEIGAALRPCLHSLSVDGKVVSSVQSFLDELGRTDSIKRGFAVQVAQALQSHPIVKHGIEIDLAFEAADTLLSGAEERFGDLLQLIANRSLSERAAAFLDRATRLYLWSFEPEAIVMCASVLEAAYPERFTSLDMLRLQIQRKGAEYEAHEYESAAAAAKVFSWEQRKLAETIRRARNDVVHNVPAVALSAKLAITGTAELLSCLFPRAPE